MIELKNAAQSLKVKMQDGSTIEHTFNVNINFEREEKDSEGHVAHDGAGMDGASCVHCATRLEKLEDFYNTNSGAVPSTSLSATEIFEIRSSAVSMQ